MCNKERPRFSRGLASFEGELRIVEPGVEVVLREQGFVGALLDDVAILHDEDEVGVLDRA